MGGQSTARQPRLRTRSSSRARSSRRRRSRDAHAVMACTRTRRCASSAASTRHGSDARSSVRPSCCSQICGGNAGPTDRRRAHGRSAARAPPLRCGARGCDALLGIDVPDARVERDALERSRCAWKRDADDWLVTPPAFRFDIAIEEDLIEEVGRMVGYDAIPATPGDATERLGLDDRDPRSSRTASRICSSARGYAEAITYSFVDPALDDARQSGREPVALANPIASDMAVLRSSLWPGLIDVARHNVSSSAPARAAVRDRPAVRCRGAEASRETAVVAGLALGSRAPEHWDGAGPDVDYFDVKGDVEALLRITGRGARVSLRSRDASRAELRGERRESCAATQPSVGSVRCIPSSQSASTRNATAVAVRAAARCDIAPRRVCRRSDAIRSFRRSGAISRSSSTSRVSADA